MLQRLVPVLVFVAVMAVGAAVLVFRGWRRGRLGARLDGEGSSGVGAFGVTDSSAGGDGGFRIMSTVEQIGRAVSSGKPPETPLREWLAKAGFYEDSAPTIYVGAQLALSVLALTFGGAVAFSLNLSLMI